MTSTDDRPPDAVVLLGYGGLLPFAGTTAGVLLDRADQNVWLFALLAYAAVISSFVGALHWAFAMAPPTRSAPLNSRSYYWSVVPALVAWAALLTAKMSDAPGTAAAALLLTGVFMLHYRRDRALAMRHPLPLWYLPLRLRLSALACLCLVVSATAVWWRA